MGSVTIRSLIRKHRDRLDLCEEELCQVDNFVRDGSSGDLQLTLFEIACVYGRAEVVRTHVVPSLKKMLLGKGCCSPSAIAIPYLMGLLPDSLFVDQSAFIERILTYDETNTFPDAEILEAFRTNRLLLAKRAMDLHIGSGEIVIFDSAENAVGSLREAAQLLLGSS